MKGRVVRSLSYVTLAFVFEGWLGLVVALVAVIAYEVVRLRVSAFWAVALVALAAAPLATVLQGLPSDPVVGASFGESHIVARLLVSISLALASYAAVLELTATRVDRTRRSGSAVPAFSLRRWVSSATRRANAPRDPEALPRPPD